MEPEPPVRRKPNSSRASLLYALIFHVVLFLVGFVWAAHEGTFGKTLQEITVALVPPEKPPPEPEPPKPPPPVIPPKAEPKILPEPKPEPAAKSPEPPPRTPAVAASTTTVAPAPAVLPDFNFSDGAKPVETGTNTAVTLYKSQVEYTLRSNWERPDNLEDSGFVAEVELSLDASGLIQKYAFKKSSGNQKWDDSIKRAIMATRTLRLPQPKGFPGTFTMRFDVLQATTDF